MDTQDRYSPSFWPATALPVPRVETGMLNDLGGGWLGFGFDAEHQVTEFVFEPPPAEMHLREVRDADLADPLSLRRLASVAGAPVGLSQWWRGYASPTTDPRAAEPQFYGEVEAIARQLDLAPPADWRDRPRAGAFHLTEVAHGAARVRLLTDHLVRSLDGEPVAPVWQAAGFFDADELESALLPPAPPGGRAFDEESAEKVAWYYFTNWLNNGLSPFSAHVVEPEIDSLPPIRDITTSYSAACVLVFNDLVDGLPYRRCQDETCGRVFRRQLGRSEGQFYRSEGVAYCTPQHARNQAQRERRRRERKARMGTSDG